MTFNGATSQVLAIDCAAEVRRISRRLIEIVCVELHRRGVVIALSGGVDSSVCAGLAAKAFGANKVRALVLPERESSPSSARLGRDVADRLGIPCVTQDITSVLEAIGCYSWRDRAIRTLFPDYDAGWKSKIVISGGMEGGLNFFKLMVQAPNGRTEQKRLPHREYLQIVAAQNFKQRVRKTIEYFHADRLNYAVLGTPNRLEYDQGFFVKNGDGSADVKPIAHLYKTQVYALARYLGLPDEICNSTPMTDTYSLSQGQDEFFFGLPHDKMDLALWAHDNHVPARDLARLLSMTERQAELVYRDIRSKRKATRYLHARPLLVEDLPEMLDFTSGLTT
jgi:NAD+ synthase